MKYDPETVILVPARLASTRFPDKLLHKIRGRSLLLRVADRIKKEAPEYQLLFAVDDARLESPLKENGFECIMTSSDHKSGTDRLAEANRNIGARYIINVQGDEPLVTGDQIRTLAKLVQEGSPMATLASVFTNQEDFFDINQVKVVMNNAGEALYFSRNPIPYYRDAGGSPSNSNLVQHLSYRHLGMYSYQADFLEKFASLPQGRLEQLERLEQLRALEDGYKIAVSITSDPSFGIDTPEDAKRYEQMLQRFSETNL
tara:strand:+ start:177 stop:950 length:774 start_codon:yes stop_codon:yes gene_type:complete